MRNTVCKCNKCNHTMIDKQPLPNQPKVMIATSVGKMFEDKYNGIPIFVCEKCLTNIDIEKVMNTMK